MPSANNHGTFISLLIKRIPNVLTLINMLSGLTVLYLSICKTGKDYRVISCVLILIAAVLDAFDGTIARLVGAESEFGKQLDSFADLVSFGIAPIAILLTVEPIGTTPVILIVLALYLLAGAFRLSRYNLGNYTHHFVGLPITAAGFIQACFVLVINRYMFSTKWILISTAFLTAILSVMMISTFKINRYKVNCKK